MERVKSILGLILPLWLGCGFFSGEIPPEDEEAWLKTARLRMVEQQLRQRGITAEPVLQAMATIPRHAFVPAELRLEAHQSQIFLDNLPRHFSQLEEMLPVRHLNR